MVLYRRNRTIYTIGDIDDRRYIRYYNICPWYYMEEIGDIDGDNIYPWREIDGDIIYLFPRYRR